MKSNCFNRFGRSLAAALLAAAALPGFSPAANAELPNNPPQPLPRRPCIILIVADGLGYGDLSCYGQTRFQTPNLDRLAAEGIRFTGYYAGDAVKSPARASLMLGRNSLHLRQRADVDVPLASGDTTFARLLKQSGYHTGFIGEWDLGDDATAGAPWKQGFDEFAGYFDPNDAENFYADYLWRYVPPSGLTTNSQEPDFIGKAAIYSNAGGGKGQYMPDLYTKAALNFIQNNQPDQFNHYRPFFLLLNYKIPGGGRGQVPTDAPFSSEPWPQAEKNKVAMITRLDGYLGQLLEQLQKLNLTNNTVIFFTSDTGPEKGGGVDPKFFRSGGPFRGGRGELYEGGLRVPMMVYWPERIGPHQVSSLNWAAWDFLPTVMDIALTQSPTNIDGISVLPALSGQTPTNRHAFFNWVLREHEIAQAMRSGDWKIVQPKTDAQWELYNLKADPGEKQNVADKNPDVVAELEKQLKK